MKTKFLENTPAISLLRDKLQSTLVESSNWRNGEQQVVWKRKYIKGLDGRMVHVRSPHAALNTLLQSAGALICKEWIVETEKLIQAEGYKHGFDGDYALMGYIHDETQWACRTPEIANRIIELAQQAMRNVQEIFKFKCQLDTDGKIGKNWAECH